jgi:hypothetical protein
VSKYYGDRNSGWLGIMAKIPVDFIFGLPTEMTIEIGGKDGPYFTNDTVPGVDSPKNLWCNAQVKIAIA